jgi:hypothetical protein
LRSLSALLQSNDERHAATGGRCDQLKDDFVLGGQMKRVFMLVIGSVVAIAVAFAILVLFVHRPPECGEPAACGDDYLFPALYFAGIAFAATLAVAVFQSKPLSSKWSVFLLRMAVWVSAIAVAIAVTYFTGTG